MDRIMLSNLDFLNTDPHATLLDPAKPGTYQTETVFVDKSSLHPKWGANGRKGAHAAQTPCIINSTKRSTSGVKKDDFE